jgi:hypothetical protein
MIAEKAFDMFLGRLSAPTQHSDRAAVRRSPTLVGAE